MASARATLTSSIDQRQNVLPSCARVAIERPAAASSMGVLPLASPERLFTARPLAWRLLPT